MEKGGKNADAGIIRDATVDSGELGGERKDAKEEAVWYDGSTAGTG